MPFPHLGGSSGGTGPLRPRKGPAPITPIPELDLAANKVRTFSGAHVRDIIFYNDGKMPFLVDLRETYGTKHLVFELKNVEAVDTEHVIQLYRYLDNRQSRDSVQAGQPAG